MGCHLFCIRSVWVFVWKKRRVVIDRMHCIPSIRSLKHRDAAEQRSSSSSPDAPADRQMQSNYATKRLAGMGYGVIVSRVNKDNCWGWKLLKSLKLEKTAWSRGFRSFKLQGSVKTPFARFLEACSMQLAVTSNYFRFSCSLFPISCSFLAPCFFFLVACGVWLAACNLKPLLISSTRFLSVFHPNIHPP